MADSAPAKVKFPPKTQPQQKKKKKNAPDKPQPAWLFPPDEENPVLNPKPKTNEDTIKETQEREKALEFMKRRVHAVPDRPAPPSQLLTLVGIFLSDFGFNSTSRLFTNERKARQELNGWDNAVGKKIEKGTPKLESIYRDWYREWKATQNDETSSSESGSESGSESDSAVELSTKGAANNSSGDDSDASSDSSDVKMKEVPKNKKAKSKSKRIQASSSASSTSESDADDEDEKIKPPSTASKKATNTVKQATIKPTVGATSNSLKRKVASGSPDTSEASSATDEEELPQIKKAKTTATSTSLPATIPAGPKQVDTVSNEKKASSSSSDSSSASDSESSLPTAKSIVKVNQERASKQAVKQAAVAGNIASASSSESDSESDSDAPNPTSTTKRAIPAKSTSQAVSSVQAPSSDSSATINGDSKKPSASASSASGPSSATSSESSDSDADSAPEPSPKKLAVQKIKKKHPGAKQTPLAVLSANSTGNSYVSNKYQNYDYADRAYKDLSVTKGKGFTKEKNKKKRGSYRGGAIDTSGGKSFKFED